MSPAKRANLLTIAVLSSSLFCMHGAFAVQDIAAPAACNANANPDDCQTEGVVFSADATVTVADTKNIGNVGGVSATTTAGAGTGTIVLAGGSTITGSVGTAALPISNIASIGVGVINLNGDVFASKAISGFDFAADSTLNIAAGKNFNGTIDASGGAGTGTLNFLGNSVTGGDIGTNTALKAVNTTAGGTLTMNHNILATTTTVAAGSTLSVNANLNLDGILDNKGTVDVKGNTLTVTTGQYLQPAGSTLSVDVTGGAAPASGKVQAGGGSTIDAGSTVNVNLTGNALPVGTTTLTIVTDVAPPGVPTTVTGSSATTALSVAANVNNLEVTAVTKSIASVVTNPALSGISNAMGVIGSNVTASAPGLAPLVANLQNQPNAQALENALVALSPVSDGSNVIAAQNHIVYGIEMASHRMERLRLAMNTPSYNAGDVYDDTSVWVEVYGHDINQKRRDGVDGYDAWNAGISFGVDDQIMRDFLIGAGFNYAFTDIESKSFTKNELDVKTYQGFLYGSWQVSEPVYWDGLLSFAYHDYDASRYIVIPAAGGAPGFNLMTEGDYNAWQFTAWTEVGYEWKMNNWILTPHASLKYSHLKVDGYDETSAGALALNVDYDDVDQFVLAAGLRAGYLVDMNNGVTFHPHVFGQVLHDFINDRQQSTANFIGGGINFITPGIEPDDTSFRVGAGVDFAAIDEWVVSVDYNFEFKDDYREHGGYLKFRYEWN